MQVDWPPGFIDRFTSPQTGTLTFALFLTVIQVTSSLKILFR